MEINGIIDTTRGSLTWSWKAEMRSAYNNHKKYKEETKSKRRNWNIDTENSRPTHEV